jgi:hypothetical protein
MIVDNTLVFSDSQAVTATAASTNTIDLGAAGTPAGASAALTFDIGKGTNIPILIEVTEAFATLTSLTFSLETDDNTSFSSPTTVAQGPAVLAAALTLGAVINFPAEVPIGVAERYLRLKYTVGGSSATAGKIFAGIVAARQTNP